ncbi:MAG TPA: hypothetical protein VJ020_02215, partial [Anaerolineales bacterium]|nr:hypothetical protein [Anaerolineales bacterium]
LDEQVAYQNRVGQVAGQSLAELRKLAQGVQELAMRRQEWREKLEQMSGAQRGFADAMHSLEAQFARLSDEQSDHNRRFDQFAQDISHLADAGQKLSQQFTETNNAHDEQLQATNRELLQLAAALQQQEQALAEAGVEQRSLQDGLTDLAKTQSEIKVDHQSLQSNLAELANMQGGFAQQLEQARSSAQGVEGRLTQIAADSQGSVRWLEQVAHNQRGQHEWIELIQRKLELLMLDARENKGPADADDRLPEPRIVDREAYQRLLAEMGDQIKVNAGCGEKTWPGYVNVDLRELRGVDVIADVRRLPFDPASLAELASAHLIEHFREHQFQTRVLPYWRGLLKPGGVLRVICPNWSAMLARLGDGRMPLADFKRLTFGAQDYAGNDHFAMYTPETLRSLLLDSGFLRVGIQAEDRMNGICPEMEVWAWV